MLGLFGTLNLGTRSLQTQQAGVEIAGQNLANINSPGYARQRVLIQTSPAVLTSVGPQGSGAELAGIQQIRDALLDGLVQRETSVGGYWNAQGGALQSAQTALGEFLDGSASALDGSAAAGGLAGARGLSAQLTQLFNAFQGVAASPASLPQRQALVHQAHALGVTFNQAAARLGLVQQSLNTAVTRDVAKVNGLLSDIAQLNREIASLELPGGGAANDLRDMRLQKLEALAGLVDFETGSTPEGRLTVSIGGVECVSGPDRLETLEAYDAGGGKMLVRAAGSGVDLALPGGSVAGAIAARDGALAGLQAGLDNLAGQLIAQVNSVYRAGYDLDGNTGADFFTGTNAATIGIRPELLNDPNKVQAGGVAGAAGDNQVALALARLATAKQPGLGDRTFGEAYGETVAGLGHALVQANQQSANHEAVAGLLLAQRDAVSGVSIEEEMSALIGFQKAYQASARIVTTVDQMLDTILNMKR